MTDPQPDRRTALLEAAIGVIADHGLSGLTHRAVDAAAGLPQGSTSYYFPKKDALLVAAADRLAQLLEQDCEALQTGFARIAAAEGLESAIAFVSREVLAYAEAERRLSLARLDLTLAAQRRPELGDIGTRLTAAARRPIAFFLQLVSKNADPAAIAACAGLVDGIGLMHAAGQGPEPTADQVGAVLRAIL